jgi:hypothetical protein
MAGEFDDCDRSTRHWTAAKPYWQGMTHPNITAKTLSYFLIETPEVTLTFIGSVQHDPLAPGMVWLCAPGGRRLIQCPGKWVAESTREQTAQRILADARAIRAEKASRN